MRDIEELQGTWRVTALQFDGRTVDPATFPGARIVISGRRFESLGMGATYEGDISIDESSSPKRFSLFFTSGPEKGKTNFGIYELAGPTWTFCLNTHGKERPGEFATRDGSGNALQVLTRERAPRS